MPFSVRPFCFMASQRKAKKIKTSATSASAVSNIKLNSLSGIVVSFNNCI